MRGNDDTSNSLGGTCTPPMFRLMAAWAALCWFLPFCVDKLITLYLSKNELSELLMDNYKFV